MFAIVGIESNMDKVLSFDITCYMSVNNVIYIPQNSRYAGNSYIISILDTDDGVIEKFTCLDIVKFLNSGIKIEGIRKRKYAYHFSEYDGSTMVSISVDVANLSYDDSIEEIYRKSYGEVINPAYANGNHSEHMLLKTSNGYRLFKFSPTSGNFTSVVISKVNKYISMYPDLIMLDDSMDIIERVDMRKGVTKVFMPRNDDGKTVYNNIYTMLESMIFYGKSIRGVSLDYVNNTLSVEALFGSYKFRLKEGLLKSMTRQKLAGNYI